MLMDTLNNYSRGSSEHLKTTSSVEELEKLSGIRFSCFEETTWGACGPIWAVSCPSHFHQTPWDTLVSFWFQADAGPSVIWWKAPSLVLGCACAPTIRRIRRQALRTMRDIFRLCPDRVGREGGKITKFGDNAWQSLIITIIVSVVILIFSLFLMIMIMFFIMIMIMWRWEGWVGSRVDDPHSHLWTCQPASRVNQPWKFVMKLQDPYTYYFWETYSQPATLMTNSSLFRVSKKIC